MLAALLELGLDLGAAAAERPPDRGGDPIDLGHAVTYGGPFDAEATGELDAQLGLIEEAAGAGMGVEAPGVEGGPAAVRAAGHVRHEDVGVQLRVAGAAGAVPEARRDESVAEHRDRAALAAAAEGGVAFHVVQRGVDGGLMRLARGSRDVLVAEAEEQADTLGGRERQIEPGHAALALAPTGSTGPSRRADRR